MLYQLSDTRIVGPTDRSRTCIQRLKRPLLHQLSYGGRSMLLAAAFSFLHVSPRSGPGGNRTHFQELKRLLLAIELQTQTSTAGAVAGDNPLLPRWSCFFAFDYSVFSEHVEGACSCFCRGAARLSAGARTRTGLFLGTTVLQTVSVTLPSTPACSISAERATGIGPVLQPWQGRARPLRHARIFHRLALLGLLGSSCRACSPIPLYRDCRPFLEPQGRIELPFLVYETSVLPLNDRGISASSSRAAEESNPAGRFWRPT